MTKAEFLEELAVVLDVPEGSLKGPEVLEELPEWDSLAVISFIALVDDKFNHVVSGDSLAKAVTIDDLVRLAKIDTAG
ncbi:acyl carrier protein [Acetobacter lambici]|uniref:Acyl carrier protein n=1 Tax=Acetobacter lambici TaxID=1332824 RepID=A0ABT1EY20_9PROT|nr:acyl carrier protein [Acetobacter lambici]MCP1241727.1 acyl carrier protein [Acetobacter lambici]MCP1257852.1 acyl carrier protein [Acetobacter lambici]NHO56560.1 acyl carrier protein [Acetobacter lambici]